MGTWNNYIRHAFKIESVRFLKYKISIDCVFKNKVDMSICNIKKVTLY